MKNLNKMKINLQTGSKNSLTFLAPIRVLLYRLETVAPLNKMFFSGRVMLIWQGYMNIKLLQLSLTGDKISHKSSIVSSVDFGRVGLNVHSI